MKKNIKELMQDEKILMVIIAILVVLFAILLSFPNITTPIKNIMNKEKIYSVEVIKISGCDECFNLGGISSSLNKIENLKIKDEKEVDYNSIEGKKLIEKYNIEKIPALIVLSKNLVKINLDENLFRKDGKAAIFDKSVPYINLNTNKINGLVQLKEIQSDNCIDCASLSKLKTQFEELGIKVENYEIIKASSDKGKEIIRKNNLDFTSALLISKDIKEYWWIFDQINNSFIEKEDNYLFKIPIAPYLDLRDGKIKGKVDITFIEDKSCAECFNAIELKDSLQGLGVYFYSEKHVDISSTEGRNLLEEYNITAIPTIILSKEIQDYDSVKKILEQAGTFEDDNTYVFRKLDALNVKYKKI